MPCCIRVKGKSFGLKPNETLLEGLQRNGCAVEYQCREGYCGSCRLRISQGNVAYIRPPLAFALPGEVIACCAVAKSDIVLAADITLPKVG